MDTLKIDNVEVNTVETFKEFPEIQNNKKIKKLYKNLEGIGNMIGEKSKQINDWVKKKGENYKRFKRKSS